MKLTIKNMLKAKKSLEEYSKSIQIGKYKPVYLKLAPSNKRGRK